MTSNIANALYTGARSTESPNQVNSESLFALHANRKRTIATYLLLSALAALGIVATAYIIQAATNDQYDDCLNIIFTDNNPFNVAP
jgi:hypothetical protein